MTDRELMQQALDAMLNNPDEISDEMFESIKALKERLAQPEHLDELTIWKSRALQAERVIDKFMQPVATVVARQYEDGTYSGNALDWAGRNCEDDLPVGTKLCTSQQPAQQSFECPRCGHCCHEQQQEPFCYHDGRNIVGKEFADHSDVFPLYTAQRQWQGLSDQEVVDLLNKYFHSYPDLIHVVHMIEAILKEKNG